MCQRTCGYSNFGSDIEAPPLWGTAIAEEIRDLRIQEPPFADFRLYSFISLHFAIFGPLAAFLPPPSPMTVTFWS